MALVQSHLALVFQVQTRQNIMAVGMYQRGPAQADIRSRHRCTLKPASRDMFSPTRPRLLKARPAALSSVNSIIEVTAL